MKQKRVCSLFVLLPILGSILFLQSPLVQVVAKLGSGTIIIVSVSAIGTNGSGINAAISDNGQVVAFETMEQLVAADTNNVSDVYVYDVTSGQIELINVTPTGSVGNDRSRRAALSADGRYIAFESDAWNLVPNDSEDSTDIFVRDRQTGQIERISETPTGNTPNDDSLAADISPDGRFVAFSSDSNNMVGNDLNNSTDAYLYDRETEQMMVISVANGSNMAAGLSGAAAIASGGWVVMVSNMPLTSEDNNSYSDVYVFSLASRQVSLVSVSSSGEPGNGASSGASISADGRLIAFASGSTNFTTNDNGEWIDIFVHDRFSGETVQVSVNSDGVPGNGGSSEAQIAADGCYVVFESEAMNFVPGDIYDQTPDTFIHNLTTGTTEILSISATGQIGWVSERPVVSADGRYVAFDSENDTLVPGDTGGRDVFLRDREESQSCPFGTNTYYLPLVGRP